MRFGNRLILLILVLLISAAMFECRRGAKPKSAGPRNVYILTASGLRPDHLTCYLYQHGQTPALDYLAYDGIRFNNAYSTSPESLAAHVSLLTGLYPFSKPARDLLAFLTLSQPAIPTGMNSLPVWFRQKGYRTAAFLSDPELRQPSYFGNVFSEIFMGDSLLPAWQPAYTPVRLSLLARDWVQKHSSEPQFLLLNFSEPTLPFVPPRPFNKQYQHHPYDGEIAAVDQQIGMFIYSLKEAGLFENSILVFTSPYGESLEENIRTGNPSMDNLHVPLFIAAPGILPRHQEYNAPASLIDILPTVQTLLEQPISSALDGVPLFKKGTSEEITRETVLAESIMPRLFGLPPLYFITNGKSSWIAGQDNPGTPVLKDAMGAALRKAGVHFDSAAAQVPDFLPGALLERSMLLAGASHPDRALDLIDSLSNQTFTSPALDSWKAALAAAEGDYERAKKLLQGAGTHPLLLPSLAKIELQAGRFKAALEAQQKYVEWRRPADYISNSIMGIILFNLKRYGQAAGWLDNAIALNGTEPRVYLYRGLANAASGKKEAAEADLKRVMALNGSRTPDDYSMLIQIAQLQSMTGDLQSARELSEKVLLYSNDPALKKQARQIISGF